MYSWGTHMSTATFTKFFVWGREVGKSQGFEGDPAVSHSVCHTKRFILGGPRQNWYIFLPLHTFNDSFIGVPWNFQFGVHHILPMPVSLRCALVDGLVFSSIARNKWRTAGNLVSRGSLWKTWFVFCSLTISYWCSGASIFTMCF